MRTLKDAEELGVKFAEQNHASSIKDLRTITADALLSASQSVDSPFAFAPIVDGWLLPDTPNHMNAKATDQDVPIVTGYQAGDSQLFAPRINSLEEYEQMAHKLYGEMAPEFENLYPVKNVDDIAKQLRRAAKIAVAFQLIKFTEEARAAIKDADVPATTQSTRDAADSSRLAADDLRRSLPAIRDSLEQMREVARMLEEQPESIVYGPRPTKMKH